MNIIPVPVPVDLSIRYRALSLLQPRAASIGTGTGTSTMAAACPYENGAPAPAPDDVTMPERVALASLATLSTLVQRQSIWWWRAVAPAVTALGAIVNNYIDVSGVRIAPTYDAVVHALHYSGLGGRVWEFQAAWDELCGTPDGRAVIAVCQAAADGDALLGRLFVTRVAEEADLPDRLQAYYHRDAFLPALVAARRYYRGHAAPPAAAPPEWPPLDALLSHRYVPPFSGPPPQKWLLAVAPAVAVLERIVARLLDVAALPLAPTHDSVVETLQMSELDELVPRFEAAWETLRGTPNGRAVIAVCSAARRGDVMLGGHDMSEVAASVPDLRGALQKEYEGEEYLPVLLAAADFYLDATAAGAAAAAGGAGSCE